jgi:hypothetical protein
VAMGRASSKLVVWIRLFGFGFRIYHLLDKHVFHKKIIQLFL